MKLLSFLDLINQLLNLNLLLIVSSCARLAYVQVSLPFQMILMLPFQKIY